MIYLLDQHGQRPFLLLKNLFKWVACPTLFHNLRLSKPKPPFWIGLSIFMNEISAMDLHVVLPFQKNFINADLISLIYLSGRRKVHAQYTCIEKIIDLIIVTLPT